MLVVALGEASSCSQMPFSLGHSRPLLRSASRVRAKMPLFLNLRTMPGQHSLPQRTEGSRTGWELHFLGQRTSPSDGG